MLNSSYTSSPIVFNFFLIACKVLSTFFVDKLRVKIFANRTLMGEDAAKDIKDKIKELLSKKAEINMI